MTTNYTIFTSYVLAPTGTTSGHTSGYQQGIHCNYFKSMQIETDNLYIQEVSLNFANTDDFKFLSSDVSNGTGYTVHRIYMLVQTGLTTTTIKPVADAWKIYDVTSQVTGYTGIGFLTANQITSVVFKAPLKDYAAKDVYDLDYLSYPSSIDETSLCFGDETYFFGNVTTSIKADVYVTDLSINLGLNQFNSTTNTTWDSVSRVYITEIGLYDNNKNLVAIGKLNDPVPKDGTISRTIVFALDF